MSVEEAQNQLEEKRREEEMKSEVKCLKKRKEW